MTGGGCDGGGGGGGGWEGSSGGLSFGRGGWPPLPGGLPTRVFFFTFGDLGGLTLPPSTTSEFKLALPSEKRKVIVFYGAYLKDDCKFWAFLTPSLLRSEST